MLYPDDYMIFSLDQQWGGFGFAHKDEAFAAFVCFGLSSGFFGTVGFILCLVFFSPVIVSSCILLLPFVGQIIGFAMDLDRLPGWMTWVGTALVCLGVLGIQRAERQRKNDQAEEEAKQEELTR